jgi:tetratricopeptide (TPR) repeat protein
MELLAADASSRKAKSDVAQVLTWAGAIEPDPQAALPNLRRAITMLAELRAADPKQVIYVDQDALAHEYMGRHLEAQGNLAEAIGAYRQSLSARQSATVAAALTECERRLSAGR